MAYRILLSFAAFVVTLAQSPLAAQDTTNGTSPHGPSDDEVRQMIGATLQQGLPVDSVDQFVVLSMRHSAIAVPLLIAHIESPRLEATQSKNELKRVADVLAYIGNDASVEAIIHLADSDEARFGYLVTRLLDYAWGRRNPYAMAYQIVDHCQEPTFAEVAQWIRKNAGTRGAYRAWATAMVGRHPGLTPDQALLADPLVRMLPNGVTEDMNKEVTAAFGASAVQSKDR